MNWFKQKGKLVNKAFDSLDNNLDNNLSDEYIREHRILKGKFSHRQWRESQNKRTNTTADTQAEDWSITYKGKKYTSPTQEFEFILEDDLIIDEPWFFTGEPHEGNSPFRAKLFESLILPKCKAIGDTSHMFQFQVDIQYLDISKLDTSESTDLSNMLQECSYSGLSIKGLENIDTSKSVNVENLFDNSNIDNHCPANPYVYNFGNATNINGLFANHKGDLNVRRFNFSKATTAKGLFFNFKGTLDFSTTECNLQNVIDFTSAFENANIDIIDFSNDNFIITNVGNEANIKNRYEKMFKSTTATKILLPKIKLGISGYEQVVSDMIYSNHNLIEINFKNAEFDRYFDDIIYDNPKLTTFSGTIIKINKPFGNINLEDFALTKQSAMLVINALATITRNASVIFKKSTYDNLTEVDIAIATSKGWTVSSAS